MDVDNPGTEGVDADASTGILLEPGVVPELAVDMEYIAV